ncbi:DUF2478 domain-containing protein [Sedimentitalea nanhaiensis]|uniref:Nucleoside-triphosphatase THEP1 n=1 Tax=Sedimentitalea nanhaiensis TaxID=999627 RepID=A0A1I7DA41_9RHOB|nr:DUF2478 domain-containing protein [Sedimentitalea nanhaiensis]SFU08598.1 Protein of unknown function [Sedimentitalea nanhaiensis]
MALAYIRTQARGQTDLLLSELAVHLTRAGVPLGGVVQSNTQCSDSELCDMDVRVLPDGPVFRISQSLGAGSRGCRLNPAALEQAVAHVLSALDGTVGNRPDLLIINKFGKHEAAGRGFRPLIAEALMLDIPVLTAVNPTNEADFLAFAEGMAECLPTQLTSVRDWVSAILASATARV